MNNRTDFYRRKEERKGYVLFALFCFTSFFLHAQKPANTYSVGGWWGPAAPRFSPIVEQSGAITFRIKAPKADSVYLQFGEWNVVAQPLHKDSAGTWSLRIGPVAPGIYSYNFLVDGVRCLDNANPVVKAGTEIYGNVVEVPGIDSPRFDQLQNVPHGTLQIHQYNSTPLKRPRQLYVFLPPGYFTDVQKSFPVLYLRHGGGDNESSWTQESGRAHVILENLLAAKQAVPMIIVMSNGLTDGSWAGGSSKEGMQDLENELLRDIIPFMEMNFRVQRDAAHRAIAGLSMGGGQAYIMGLKHPDTFSWIGEFSAGLLSDAKFDINERVPGAFKNPAQLNKQLKLLFIGCGMDDPRFPGHRDLADNLNKSGVHQQVYNIPGGHEWKVWREELRLFMTKLFK